MNNRLNQRLWITGWPIWIKLMFGFIIAVMVPTIVAFAIIQNEAQAVDRENLRNYMVDEGAERRDAVTRVFQEASEEIAGFANSFLYRPVLLELLSGDRLETDLQEFIDSEFIPQGIFSRLLVISPEGRVLLSNTVSSGVDRTPLIALGTDFTDTPTFIGAQAASQTLSDQRLVVNASRDEPTLEIVHVIYEDNVVFGYLAATMNYRSLLQNAIWESDEFVETFTYLSTTNGSLIITLPENEEQAALSAQVSPIPRAMSAESGLSTYTVGNVEYLGYYGPIETALLDTPFAIITEARADTSFTLTLVDVYNQGTIIILTVIILAGVLALLINLTITPAIKSLQRSVRAVMQGDFDSPVPVAERQDEIGALARTYVDAREQVRALLDDLRSRVAARARDIEATQTVSRFAANQRDMHVLMDNVVELIVDLFPNIYHAQIFLIDSEGINAVLRASTGEAGRKLLETGHRLEVGSVSVIGRATEEGRVITASNTIGSDIHRQNEYLPDTRSELAIPLSIGDNVFGALDVQSTESDTFTTDQINILQTMADQIAIAIENARLYQESLRRMETVEQERRKAVYQSWRDHLNYQGKSALSYEIGSQTATDTFSLQQRAIATGKPIVGTISGDAKTTPFAVPIILRGQVLGAVEWELPSAEFNQGKVQLAQELVNRLAISLENARLFQDSRRTIDRERLVNEIAAKLSSQTEIDNILQTAIREVGMALNAPQVDIQVNLPTERPASAEARTTQHMHPVPTANDTHSTANTANNEPTEPDSDKPETLPDQSETLPNSR